MARVIRCEWGYVARGETDDEVVAAIREHMRSDHEQLYASVDQSATYGWIQVE